MMRALQWSVVDWMVLATRQVERYRFVVAGARCDGEVVVLDMYVQENGKKSKVKFSAYIDVRQHLIELSMQETIPSAAIWKEVMLRYFK